MRPVSRTRWRRWASHVLQKSDHTVARQRCRSVFKEHYNIENEGHPAGPVSGTPAAAVVPG
jgi:hypothetical protein